MIDVARQVKIKGQVALEQLTSLESGPLVLEGGAPVMVYVAIDPINRAIGLAASLNGPYFIGGIAWRCGGYALMITFVFTNPIITELSPVTPSFWFTDTFQGDEYHQQACCVPSTPGTYQFGVNYKDPQTNTSGKIDPIIVVTPL